MRYNEEHHITPQQIKKAVGTSLASKGERKEAATIIQHPTALNQKASSYGVDGKGTLSSNTEGAFAADPIIRQMTREQLEKSIANTTALMKQAAKDLDFIQAAQYRDEIIRLQDLLESK